MLPFDKMPYTNFHELNLAYFIVHFKEIFAEWENLYNRMLDWREQTDADLTLWKTDTLNAIEDYERDLTDAWNTWKAETALDIADWKADTLEALDAWKTAFQTLFDNTFTNLSQIKTDAEAARDAAVTAQNRAEAAAETLVLDSTLTSTTQAAQAKAVGDAIERIRSIVDEIENALTESNLITEIQLPFDWERGNINNSGVNANSARYIRTPEFTEITPGTYSINTDRNTYSHLVCGLYIYSTNETFENKTNYIQPNTFTIEQNSKIRLVLYFGSNDTTTVLDPSEGNVLVTITTPGVQDVKPDTTLTLAGRSAEAKATREAIDNVKNILFEKTIYMEWEQGKISSTGTNSESTNPAYIRNKNKYKIGKNNVHLTVPNNITVELYAYDRISGGAGSGFINQIGTYTEDANIEITPNTFVRLVAYYSDMSATPISIGDDVLISYKASAQEVINEIENSKIDNFSNISLFETMGVIGDSWASGSIHTPNGYIDTVYSMSWPQILGRSNDIDVVNYSAGGLNTKTWLTNPKGLNTLLADPAKQCYLINLGINDNAAINDGSMILGTIADVNTSDYTLNPDTFFGNYGKIVGNIKLHAPKAIVILLSIARPNERNMDSYIKQIAEKYNIPFINLEKDEYFMSGYFYGSIYDGHMSAFGYSGMAKAIQRLIQNYIVKNRLMFAYYDGLTN